MAEAGLQDGKRAGAGPLAGVRVLALEQMQALPYATQLLAHLGAEVVKVEPPGRGEAGRGALPSIRDTDGRQVGATYLRNNLGKRSLTLDLKHPEGRALFERLLPRFDVVGENFRPGTLERLGLGFDRLAEIHPPVILVSISGFGSDPASPYRSWPAYACVAEAMGGFYEENREPGRPPRVGPAGALGDIGTALYAAVGVLAALLERDRTGRGRRVEVAMFDAMVAMADVYPNLRSLGVEHFSREATPGIWDAFRADDGYFVVQAVREPHLELFARAVGHPEWLEDARLADRAGWTEHLETLIRPAVESWARGRTKRECAAELARAGVAAGPCFSAADLEGDPHVRARRMLFEIPRPDAPTPVRVTGNPIRLSDREQPDPSRWPLLGEHTDEILRGELGLSPDEIGDLRRRGVV